MVSGPGRREPRAHHVEMWAGQMQRLRGSQVVRTVSGQSLILPACYTSVRGRQGREALEHTAPGLLQWQSVLCLWRLQSRALHDFSR